jgi:hypothetical protein
MKSQSATKRVSSRTPGKLGRDSVFFFGYGKGQCCVSICAHYSKILSVALFFFFFFFFGKPCNSLIMMFIYLL